MGSWDQNFIFSSEYHPFSHADDNFLLEIEAEAGYIQCVWASPCEIQSSGGRPTLRESENYFVVQQKMQTRDV